MASRRITVEKKEKKVVPKTEKTKGTVSRNSDQLSKLTEMIIDFLLTIPIFDGCTSHQLQLIAGHMNYITVNKDELLFKEGDKGSYVCFVVEGTLDVIKQTNFGGEMVIAKLRKGRSIGEMALIDHTPRSASVKAMEDCTMLTLSNDSFELLLDESPKAGIIILKGIARLLSLNMRKTSSRLADYMLSIS